MLTAHSKQDGSNPFNQRGSHETNEWSGVGDDSRTGRRCQRALQYPPVPRTSRLFSLSFPCAYWHDKGPFSSTTRKIQAGGLRLCVYTWKYSLINYHTLWTDALGIQSWSSSTNMRWQKSTRRKHSLRLHREREKRCKQKEGRRIVVDLTKARDEKKAENKHRYPYVHFVDNDHDWVPRGSLFVQQLIHSATEQSEWFTSENKQHILGWKMSTARLGRNSGR